MLETSLIADWEIEDSICRELNFDFLNSTANIAELLAKNHHLNITKI